MQMLSSQCGRKVLIVHTFSSHVRQQEGAILLHRPEGLQLHRGARHFQEHKGAPPRPTRTGRCNPSQKRERVCEQVERAICLDTSSHVMRYTMHLHDVTFPNANARDYDIFRNLNTNVKLCRCLQTACEQKWVASGQVQVLLQYPGEH